MRIPQVTDRMKEAPAHALRAVFAGIGQVLLVADRIRSRAAEQAHVRSPGNERPGAADQTAAPAAQAAATRPAAATDQAAAPAVPGARAPAAATGGARTHEARWRSLDQTGNVRLLSAEELAAEPEPEQPFLPQPAAQAAVFTPPQPVPGAGLTATPDGPAGRVTLPVPNYDSLSLPSLRSHLRNLDAAQVRVLLDYERANADRPAVVTMFERRVAKLEDAGD
jgi:hypothetical protein